MPVRVLGLRVEHAGFELGVDRRDLRLDEFLHHLPARMREKPLRRLCGVYEVLKRAVLVLDVTRKRRVVRGTHAAQGDAARGWTRKRRVASAGRALPALRSR